MEELQIIWRERKWVLLTKLLSKTSIYRLVKWSKSDHRQHQNQRQAKQNWRMKLKMAKELPKMSFRLNRRQLRTQHNTNITLNTEEQSQHLGSISTASRLNSGGWEIKLLFSLVYCIYWCFSKDVFIYRCCCR